MSEFICTYLLPFRRARFCEETAIELANYFDEMRQAGCEVQVVDGSPPEVFAEHARIFGRSCRHLAVDRRFGFLNDKVNGIYTGVEASRFDQIILGDDDIRYTPDAVRAVIEALEKNDLVRPQNFLSPLPWWGKMEAARMLINRATLRAADYPGTCAFRRTTLLRIGPYDGDVLFDNEEIIRHFALQGCTIAYLPDLFVRKIPPSFRKWIEQRPRQAYEDFGMRAKTALFFSLPIVALLALATFGLTDLIPFTLLIAAGSITLASFGRARGKAPEFFPLVCCFFAPLWVIERSLSTYWALYWFLKRGGYPFGERLLSKGVGKAWSSGGSVISRQLRESAQPGSVRSISQ